MKKVILLTTIIIQSLYVPGIAKDSLTTHNAQSYTRFGIYSTAPNSNNASSVDDVFSILNELTIKEITYMGHYSLSSAQLSGDYSGFDEYFQKANQNIIHISPWIRSRGDSSCGTPDINQMVEYSKTVIHKYPQIKYWKILKEPDHPCDEGFPRQGSDSQIDAPTSLSIAKAISETIKLECVDCNLVWGGWGPGNIDEYYDYFLTNNFYDNFDVHGLLGYHWSHIFKYRPETSKEEWIIQSSITVKDLSDNEKAIETVKLFTYFFSLGFDRVYYEQIYDFDGGFWGNNGLIKTDGTKKEVFYSFKTMVEKLEGFLSITTMSDCDRPQGNRIESGPSGNCQYKFNFEDKKPVYVLWCSSGNCTLPSEIAGYVLVTNYRGEEEVKNASEIILTDTPVFIEGKETEEPTPETGIMTGPQLILLKD